MRILPTVLLAALCLTGNALAVEQVTTSRATDLRESPASNARTLSTIAAGLPVSVLSRKGGWVQVDDGTRHGWVRAFDLHFRASVETPSSGGPVEGIASIFGMGSRKAPETPKIATLGIRGLTPEDFKNAAANPAEAKKLQSYRVDRAAAESFAKQAKLFPVAIAYIDDGGGS